MPTDTPKKSRRPGCIRLLISSLILLALVIVLGLFWAGDFKAYEVMGDSMLPTLEKGDRLIARKADAGTLRQGDIVVIGLPSEEGQELIKRLVAMPGDSISVRNGLFMLNGQPQLPPEGAPTFSSNTLIPRTLLGPDEYFVLGDNRPVSYDSEEFGPIPAADIWGVVILRYQPWERREFLR